MTSDAVVLIGAGNMGGAMMRGWIASGIEPSSIHVVDPSPAPAMASYLSDSGINHHPAVPDGLVASALVIAIKPQMMGRVLPGLKPLVDEQTVCISIAAGTTLGQLQQLLGDCSIVRAMPNTPAMVGRGITAAVINSRVSEEQRLLADRLLKTSGPVEWLDREALIDVVTAVSGSGPAYVFHLVECMAAAGHKAGLDADVAMRLARATVSGAGELMHQSGDGAEILRKNVTSPGGTTAAALAILMREDGLQAIFDQAIEAAKQRSIELASEA